MKLIASVLGVGILGCYLFFYESPDPITPVAWTSTPMAPNAAVVYEPNNALRNVEHLSLVHAKTRFGPSYIVSDRQQNLYTGYADGTVMRTNRDGGEEKVIANTGGRPMGMRLLRDKSLLVADAKKGLLLISPQGVIAPLTANQPLPLLHVSDVLVTADESTAYFSLATQRFGIADPVAEVLEHGSTGAIYAIDLRSRKITPLSNGYAMVTGLALSPDERYLLASETNSYRIWKVELKGDDVGRKTIFKDELPGFPAHLAFDGPNKIWVALPYPRQAWVDWLVSKPLLRSFVAKLPAVLRPDLKSRAFVIAVDLNGRVVENLQNADPEHTGRDHTDGYRPIHSVIRVGEWLFFGSEVHPGIGRLRYVGAKSK
ncbi:MAG: SMP-30/gluconolactonase/LRE family protein [Burkholderiaceae bacterium]